MASLLDFTGITKLRDAWPKWKANIIAVNNQVINHVAGTADKHSAQDITYTGDFVGKTEVKAALDQAKTEIDTIVVNASIDPEVAFARDSAVKSKVFGSLDARLEEDEQDLVSYKADNATVIHASPVLTTTEINDLLVSERHIKFTDGNFMISSELFPQSNSLIELSPLTRFIATSGSFPDTSSGLMSFSEVENIAFKGTLDIAMNKSEYTTGESRHGLRFRSVKGIDFDDVNISGSGGDGLFFGSFDGVTRVPCEGITAKTITVDNCRRNGISFANAKDFLIDRIIVKNINGTNPQAGVDFEPNNPLEMLQNINIGEIVATDNVGSAIDFAIGFLNGTLNETSITIGSIIANKNIRFVVNTAEVLTVKMPGNISINKLYIHDSPNYALKLLDYSTFAIDIYINEMIVRDCCTVLSGYSYENTAIVSYNGTGAIQSKIGCLNINNLNVNLSASSFANYLAYFGGIIDQENINILNIITNKPELGIVAQQLECNINYAKSVINYVTASTDMAKYAGMVVANNSTSSRFFTLPTALKNKGQTFTIIALRGATVIQTINDELILGVTHGSDTQIITRTLGNSITLTSTGSEWLVVSVTGNYVPMTLYDHNAVETQATEAPTTGTYVVGDIVWNTAPTTQKNISHWVCRTGNTTGGVWVTFGVGRGTTAQRPVLSANDVGYLYRDTETMSLLYWTGSVWE